MHDTAMPNSSGAPVLDDTHNLLGMHIGTSYHLDKQHAQTQVSLCFKVLRLPVVC